jgi:hypothetical protein
LTHLITVKMESLQTVHERKLNQSSPHLLS